MTTSILFVCLGNICRSPLAQAAMEIAADEAGLDIEIDSAGTGDWHVGNPPDKRAQAVALQQGSVDISSYKARQVKQRDFLEYDLICALDHSNLGDLKAIGGEGPAIITLLLDHLEGQEGRAVEDPYYGDERHFEVCWTEVRAATKALAEKIVAKK